MKTQIDSINPSAKGPLFRRLMVEENLGYLRDKNGIIGFEVDLNVDQELSGFLLVAIKKHTILAYRSDIGEELKLILFPPIDKLFDSTFDMLDLQVTKSLYTDKYFNGKVIERGRLALSVKDLTPPEKDIDIPDSVSEQMVKQIENIKAQSQPFPSEPAPKPTPVPKPTPEAVYEEPEPEPEPEPKPVTDPRSDQLKAQTFERLADVGDYVHLQFKVPKTVTTQVVNKALQSDVVARKQIDSKQLAVMLFCKLFDEGKV